MAEEILMSENMLVLNLLDQCLISVEEALQLLSAMAGKGKPPQRTPGDEHPKLKLDLILEGISDV
jgi:hypothetical protein